MLTLSQDVAQYLGKDPFTDLMTITGEIFRKQPHRETLRIFIGQSPYFIKRHTGVTLTECLKNIATGKMPVIGAEQEVRAIKTVTALGIPTTPLVGHGVRGHNPLTQESFILTRSLENTLSLELYCEAWAVSPPPYETKRAILNEVARITRILHDQHCYHRDLYLCHFLLQLSAEKKLINTQPIVLHLIDLHRLLQCSSPSRRWQVKDLSALLFSALDAKITLRDVLRFLKIYTGLSLKEILAQKAWLREILDKASTLYYKSHGDLPRQRWMHEPGDILPHQKGVFSQALTLVIGQFSPQEALRVLPKQRWVLRGIYQGQDCIAKIFTKQSDYLKECQGYEALIKASIRCPKRLLVTHTQHGKYVVIYEYVQATQAKNLTEPLIDTMACMHQKGIIQTDCHLDNFLINEQGRVWVCDLGSILSRELRPCTERASLENLALLFAQFNPGDDLAHEPLFVRYAQQRDWPLDSVMNLRFWNEVNHQRRYRRRKWLEKIFRNCTAFKCKWRLTYRVCMKREFANLYSQSLIGHPSAYFNPQAQFLKQGNSATVVRAQLGTHDVVIKRYHIKNALVYVKRLLGESKATRAWRMSHAIQTLGIQTPEPLAMIEKRWVVFPQESYFVSRFVPGERLDYVIERQSQGTYDEIAQALCTLMRALRLGQCYHGDLKASNLLWHEGQLFLLDCEAAHFISQPTAFHKAHERDWNRLLVNWPSSHELRRTLEKYRES